MIRDYWRGDTSLRQVRALVENLPESSAMHRVARGHEWRLEHYMLADIHDMLVKTAQVEWRPKPPLYERPVDALAVKAEQAAKQELRPGQMSLTQMMARMEPGG